MMNHLMAEKTNENDKASQSHIKKIFFFKYENFVFRPYIFLNKYLIWIFTTFWNFIQSRILSGLNLTFSREIFSNENKKYVLSCNFKNKMNYRNGFSDVNIKPESYVRRKKGTKGI